MINKLSELVWYGDKPSVGESLGQVKSVINVAHRIRKPYWADLGKLDWTVWYFRLALPDANEATDDYLISLSYVVNAISTGQKLPVLCHCRMGGHRGPTAALFVHWHLQGRTKIAFDEGYERLVQFRSKYAVDSDRRIYRRSVLRYCVEHSV